MTEILKFIPIILDKIIELCKTVGLNNIGDIALLIWSVAALGAGVAIFILFRNHVLTYLSNREKQSDEMAPTMRLLNELLLSDDNKFVCRAEKLQCPYMKQDVA